MLNPTIVLERKAYEATVQALEGKIARLEIMVSNRDKLLVQPASERPSNDEIAAWKRDRDFLREKVKSFKAQLVAGAAEFRGQVTRAETAEAKLSTLESETLERVAKRAESSGSGLISHHEIRAMKPQETKP